MATATVVRSTTRATTRTRSLCLRKSQAEAPGSPSARRGSAERRGILAGALSIAAGLALAAAAVPLAGSGLAEVPGNSVLRRLHDGNPGATALRQLIRSREASLAWRQTGRAAKELGLARMMLAESAPETERAGQYALAERALLRGLALAPADPYAWTRLALVRMALARPAQEVARALVPALASGPNEEALLRPAARAALYGWEGLDADGRRGARSLVGAAWRADPVGTASAAAALGRAELLAYLVLPSAADGR